MRWKRSRAVGAHGRRGYWKGLFLAKTLRRKEHAMFSTALARYFGYPSRVILGYVLVPINDNRFITFGHAWTEAFLEEEGKWVGFDSTIIKSSLDNSYIPVMEIEDEGPAFGRQILEYLQHSVSRIEIDQE